MIGGVEHWDVDDPAGQPLGKVRDIRDDIEQRVRNLAENGAPTNFAPAATAKPYVSHSCSPTSPPEFRTLPCARSCSRSQHRDVRACLRAKRCYALVS